MSDHPAPQPHDPAPIVPTPNPVGDPNAPHPHAPEPDMPAQKPTETESDPA